HQESHDPTGALARWRGRRRTIDFRAERDRGTILANIATSLVLVPVVNHELHAIDLSVLHDACRDQVGDIPTSFSRKTFIEGLHSGRGQVRPAKTKRRTVAAGAEAGVTQRI